VSTPLAVYLNEFEIKTKLNNAEQVIHYATDVGDKNTKWKESLAAAWAQSGKPIKVSVLTELEALDWKRIRDR
jgi:hypothetical protein